MVDNKLMREIKTVAAQLQIEAAALAAVADIESGLVSHTMIEGRPEPLIRFEGHYFDRRLNGTTQTKARQQGLASPQAGAVKNPASQAARWRLLSNAAQIDRKAAYESTSWGMGQIMGSHWAWLGYASVDALVAQARHSADGQLQMMALYIDKAGLTDALRRHDWAGFAHGYNGPAFARNNYDGKLARAYARHAGANPITTPAPAPGILRRGSRGEDVHTLQIALTAAGHPLVIDSIFGPATEQAVKAFQARNRLVVDGIVGAATFAALGGSKKQNLADWLISLVAKIFANRLI